MYTPVSQFYYIKVGFKGVKIIQACFCDVFLWRNKKKYYEDTPSYLELYIELKMLGIAGP